MYAKLKEYYPDVQLHTNMPSEMPYATEQPSNSLPKFAGSGWLGCGKKQMFVERFEKSVFKHHLVTFEEAKEAMLDYYIKYGVVLGSSSSANYKTAKKIASEMGPNQLILTVFPSIGLPEDVKEIEEKSKLKQDINNQI